MQKVKKETETKNKYMKKYRKFMIIKDNRIIIEFPISYLD